LGLGIEIEEFFLGMELPAKVKIGISGCPFCCGESFVRDIGIFGKKKGWTIIFGGNSLTKRCLEYYAANGKKKERTARFIERTGIEAMKKTVL
jgi:NAD(P)H-nitrite reductase large subunit